MAHRINETGEGPHVIAIDKGETLQVSIRGSEGIGELCKMFGGGGRATAGGIDELPKSEITALMKEVNSRRSA
jgi:nanoRNase/pAp phosphatase (c-di-AMP/oligoRNAs hydrolase)